MLALVAALSVAAASQAQAQAKLVSVSATPRSTDASSAQGAELHDTMPDRLISAHVRDGVLTIDGMVAKVQLNYDIERTGFMYFFVPGVGTAVVSLAPMADAVKVADAFDGDKLVFAVAGHSFELSSESALLSRRKSRAKADVYVRLDPPTVALSHYPRMGYGDTAQAPYAWPLSAPEAKSKEAYIVTPPPMPASVLPSTVDTASTTAPSSH
jgi:hypothetical protein